MKMKIKEMVNYSKLYPEMVVAVAIVIFAVVLAVGGIILVCFGNGSMDNADIIDSSTRTTTQNIINIISR